MRHDEIWLKFSCIFYKVQQKVTQQKFLHTFMSVPCIKIFFLSHKNLFIHFLLSLFIFIGVIKKKIQFYAPLIVHAPLNVMNNGEQEQRKNCWCDVKIQREYNFLRSFLLCHLYLHIDWLFVGFYGTSCVMYRKRQQKDRERKK